MTAKKPPIAMSKQWRAVMTKARGRCQCRGLCGSKHTDSRGRCDTTNSHVGMPPLIAAPVDLALVVRIAPVPADAPLMALCQPCYGKALGKAKRAVKAEPDPAAVALFDLP